MRFVSFMLVVALVASARGEAQSAPPSSGGAPQVDSVALRWLDAANAKLQRLTTLRAAVARRSAILTPGKEQEIPPDTVTLLLQRSGHVRIDEVRATAKGPLTVVTVAGPNDTWEYNSRDTTVTRWNGWRASSHAPVPLRGFFTSERHVPAMGEWTREWLTHPMFQSIRLIGRETWNGVSYEVIEWTYGRSAELPSGQDVYTSRAYVDVRDTVVRRVVTTQVTAGTPSRRFDAQLLRFEPNIAIAPETFTVPTHLRERLVNPVERTPGSYVGQPWLALGKPASVLRGDSLASVQSITDLVADKRAVVLWAWNTSCSVCCEEFPLMEPFRRKYNALGIAVVAVAGGLSEHGVAQTKEYMRYHRAQMPVLFGAPEWSKPIYDNVSFVVIDPSGVVRYAGGFDLPAIEAALQQLLPRSASL